MGNATPNKNWYTAEEYQERELTAEYRSEYYFGEVFAIAGATRTHNLITGNVFALLRALARYHQMPSFFLRHAAEGDSREVLCVPECNLHL
jgi:hypothetical protein